LSTARTIAKNLFAMLTGTAITRLLTLVAVAYAARVLGVDSFGQWSFAATIAAYWGILVHLGMDAPAARYLIHKGGSPEQLIEWAVPLKLAGASCGLVAVAVVAWLLPNQTTEMRWLILFCYAPLLVAFANLSWVYVWLEKLQRLVAAQVIEQVLNLALVLALVRAPEHVARLPLAGVIAAGGAVVVSWIWWRRDGRRFRWRLDFAGMWALLREGIQITLSQAAVQLYLGCGILFLGLASTNAQVALYSVGNRLATPLALLRMTLVTSLNPTFWRLYSESRENLAEFANRIVRYSTCALVPAATGITVLSVPAVRLIFGASYEGGAPALSLLGWWLTVMFLNMSGEMILYAAARQDVILKLSVGALLLAVGFNFWFVPRWGATGAAAAMLLVELIWLPVRFHLAHRCVPVAFWRSLARPCLCATLLGAWLWCFRDGNLWIHVPVALGLYTAGLFLTRAVIVGELRELWQALRPLR
jgi:O-antigen/teichoic acid export membrane protein